MLTTLIALAVALASPAPSPPRTTSSAPIAAAVDDGVLRVLIERHAAPHWKLTVAQAWSAYWEGTLTVDELGPGSYQLGYADGILQVLIQDDGV